MGPPLVSSWAQWRQWCTENRVKRKGYKMEEWGILTWLLECWHWGFTHPTFFPARRRADTLLEKMNPKQGKTYRNGHLDAPRWSSSQPTCGNHRVAGCAICLPLAGRWGVRDPVRVRKLIICERPKQTEEKNYMRWKFMGKKILNHTSSTQPISFLFPSGLKPFRNCLELPSQSVVYLFY